VRSTEGGQEVVKGSLLVTFMDRYACAPSVAIAVEQVFMPQCNVQTGCVARCAAGFSLSSFSRAIGWYADARWPPVLVGLGHDNLFHGDRYRWSARVTVNNVTTRKPFTTSVHLQWNALCQPALSDRGTGVPLLRQPGSRNSRRASFLIQQGAGWESSSSLRWPCATRSRCGRAARS